MAKVELTPSQKDEIRRLTQLANRRIKYTEKAYSAEGKLTLPRELVGDFQIREKWQTKANPLSRSVKFETTEAYNAQLKMLREFETKKIGIKEYTAVQRVKTLEAIQTSLGIEEGFRELKPDFVKKINRMTAPQLSDFWNAYKKKTERMGVTFSSLSSMEDTLHDFFPEDVDFVLEIEEEE